MTAYRSAFGLNLRGDLPVSGLPAGVPGLPEVRLRLVPVEDVDRAWSGAATPGAWRGTLRDGAELTIRWGRAGDLLFGYGDESRFLLDPAGARLLCAPADPGSLAWQRVLLSRVLPVVAIARGHEALHAAAVSTPAGAVAIAGASGAGKSTLATELVRRGHALLGDDVLAVGRAGDDLLAFPGGAHLSLAPGEEADLGAEVVGELGGKLWAVVEGAAQEPVPVAAVVLLERGEGPVRAQELAASPLPLAPFMLGLPDEEGREGERFGLYSDLVEAGRLISLRGSGSPRQLAEALERAVATPTSAQTAAAGAAR